MSWRCLRTCAAPLAVSPHSDRNCREMLLREIIKRMRHDGCGGRAGKVELMTGHRGASPAGRCGGSCCLVPKALMTALWFCDRANTLVEQFLSPPLAPLGCYCSSGAFLVAL